MSTGAFENDDVPTVAPPYSGPDAPPTFALYAGHDPELTRSGLNLAQAATQALGPVHHFIQIQQQMLLDAGRLAQTVEYWRRQNDQASMDMARALDSWRRFQERGVEQLYQARGALTSLVTGLWPWLKRTAKAAGEKFAEYYLRAAPPNWTTDPDRAMLDYIAAARLALDEGIPLAWVPDQETVQLLVAVPGQDDARRARLHRILDDRYALILDYCELRLDQVAADSAVSVELRQMIDGARQSVQALRSGLIMPAQAGATTLFDQLLQQAMRVIYGRGTSKRLNHSLARERVGSLSQLVSSMGLTMLGVLSEVATLAPVYSALTPWWPNDGTPPPTSFSRHVTAHHIAAPDQATPINALIAVMLAVSLLSQQHASGWSSLTMMRVLNARAARLNASQRS